jgi:hypothetical protein
MRQASAAVTPSIGGKQGQFRRSTTKHYQDVYTRSMSVIICLLRHPCKEINMSERVMNFRPRTHAGLGESRTITVSIGPVEKCESPARHRCVVTIVPSRDLPKEVFGRDAISALVAAIGAVDAFCRMLEHLGELRMESGELYDRAVHGIEGVCQRSQQMKFPPS